MRKFFRIETSRIPAGSIGAGAHQVWLGFKQFGGSPAEMADALKPWCELEWVRSIRKNCLNGRTLSIENYIADLSNEAGKWPADILDYGVERLRSELAAAGFEPIVDGYE